MTEGVLMSSNKPSQQLVKYFSDGSQDISVIPAKVRKSPSAVPQCRMNSSSHVGLASYTTGGLQTKTSARETKWKDRLRKRKKGKSIYCPWLGHTHWWDSPSLIGWSALPIVECGHIVGRLCCCNSCSKFSPEFLHPLSLSQHQHFQGVRSGWRYVSFPAFCFKLHLHFFRSVPACDPKLLTAAAD